MKPIICIFLFTAFGFARPAPAANFVFPDQRHEKKLEPIITPPILPVLEHLERDPSTLLPGESSGRNTPGSVKPRFGGDFSVKPSGNGGLTASVSSSGSGPGLSHSASQSFSFGFNEGFSASHSASQASSFNSFGNGFSGSQASSQAASFSGSSISGAASSASALNGFGSQSASSAFGFNSLNDFQPDPVFGEGLLDIRHRGVPSFPLPSFIGRGKGPRFTGNAVAFRSRPTISKSRDDFLALLVS